MRRYLIIFLAVVFSIGLFFLTKYILNKLTKNNQIFYSTLVSVIGLEFVHEKRMQLAKKTKQKFFIK